MVTCVLCVLLASHPGQVRFSRTGSALTIETPVYRFVLDARTGAMLRLSKPGAAPLAIGTAEGSLWRMRFRDDSWLSSADAARETDVQAEWDEGKNSLTLKWHTSKADVAITIAASEDHLEATALVTNRASVPVLTFVFPNELAMPKDGLRLLTWPESTGLGLTSKWLEPPTDDAPSRWQDETVGDRLFRRLTHFGAQMRDLPGTPKPLRVTEMGRSVLDENVASRIVGQKAAVVRPPEKEPDAVLLETDDGPYLCAFRLGGKGWFAYFTGTADEDMALPVVPNLVRAWARQDSRGIVGLVSLRGRTHGGWMSVPISRWEQTLPTSIGNLRLSLLRSATALRNALGDERTVAIFNPYGEHLPADSLEEAETCVDVIREFVCRGGVWIDGAGYPFYYITQRGGFGRLSGTYPPLFCDFLHLASDYGQLAVYRTEKEGQVFVPAGLELRGAEINGEPSAVFTHSFATWVEPIQAWQAPNVVLLVGHDLKSSAARYVRDNGFTVPLTQKMAAEKLERFVRSLLLRLTGHRAADYLAYLPKLPSPAIIHMTEHLHVGFDKAYPDYLPPRPDFGTMDELRALYRKGRELGFLMMPYVNPTWWCDNSPSLARHSNAVLALGLDGKPYREAYGYSEPRNRGYSICALHPIVRELDDKCLRDFVDDLGCDILFQDQIGARGWLYDLNPAEPTPYAYSEGMIQLARNDSKRVPLSTERGWDRLINYEVQFCGVAFGMVPKKGRPLWSPCFWETFGEGEWQSSPVAVYMAHDKVAFALHDLGHFIDDESALAMALPLGHQLSLAMAVGTPQASPPFRWLQWLDTLQKQVASEYMTRRLDSYRHLSQLAMEARYGPLTVVGSIEPKPVAFGDVVMASPGYYVRHDDGSLEAGRLVRYGGREYPAEAPLEFVRRQEGRRERWWLYSDQTVLLPTRGARAAMVLTAEGPRPAEIVSLAGKRWVKCEPPVAGIQPPQPLVDLAPQEWPDAPRYVGVLCMEPNGPQPAWADGSPDRWLEALRNSSLVAALRLEVRKLIAPEDILGACRAPQQWFSILNPYGELFPVPAADRVEEMLQAVAQYVAHGGIWWETGGYSFYYPWCPVVQDGRIVQWQGNTNGIAGLARLLGPADILPDNPPPERLLLTPQAHLLLSSDTREELSRASAVVNRPLSGEGGWILATGPHGPYVAGYRMGGWGYLFRVGGKGQFELTLPFVEGALAYLFRTPPKQWPPAEPRAVWSVVLEE